MDEREVKVMSYLYLSFYGVVGSCANTTRLGLGFVDYRMCCTDYLYTLSHINRFSHPSAGIFKQSMGARNRVGIGLSPHRPNRLHRLSESILWNWFLGSLKVKKYHLRLSLYSLSLINSFSHPWHTSPPFLCSSADYSKRQSDQFGKFLRRLKFAQASIFLYETNEFFFSGSCKVSIPGNDELTMMTIAYRSISSLFYGMGCPSTGNGLS